MGNRLSSRSVITQLAAAVACTAALLGSASSAFATPIPLPREGNAAAVGAFDVAPDGSTTPGSRSTIRGYQDDSSNAFPGAIGSFATPAHHAPAASNATEGEDHTVAVRVEKQLVETLARQGLMGPAALEPANLEVLGGTPAVYAASVAAGNATGEVTPGASIDPAAALVVQIPDVITSLEPSVAIVNVGSSDDGGLHWNAGDSTIPDTSSAFAGTVLTNTDVPMTDDPGNAPASGGLSLGAVANVAAEVPEPASMLLLGSGLAAAGARRWRRKQA